MVDGYWWLVMAFGGCWWLLVAIGGHQGRRFIGGEFVALVLLVGCHLWPIGCHWLLIGCLLVAIACLLVAYEFSSVAYWLPNGGLVVAW